MPPPVHTPISRPSAPGIVSWQLVLGLIVWVAATVGATAWVVRSSVNAAEREFLEYGELFHAQLREKLRANEAVLYGFSAFLGAIPRDDLLAASQYARSILERYPHIYMLEVVRRVSRSDLAAFTQQMRRKWQRNFEVRRFDYRGERQWAPLPDKARYYPIILAEPESEASRQIIGLDIDSLSGLRSALIRSEKQGTPSVSEPFRLVEGDQAYVLFRPIQSPSGEAKSGGLMGDTTYALMVVRARDLMPTSTALNPAVGHTASLIVGGSTTELFAHTPSLPPPVGSGLFAPLRIERSLDDLSQSITLSLERRIGIGDLSGIGLVTVALASMFSLTMLLGYAGSLNQRERRREAELRTIEHLALHDQLTGLPNRFLLLGRLEQVLTTAQRHGTKLAVMFLDLDGFKPINDRFGHHAGDAVLREIGWRLRQCIRDCDTVARHGGDEFVVVLTDMREAGDAASVAEKILLAVAEPLEIEGEILHVTTSVGIAIFPDTGSDAETLLRAADAAMYEAKAEGRRIYRFATRDVSTPQTS